MSEDRVKPDGRNEGAFRSLAKLLPEAIFVLSRDEILYMNELGARLFGVSNPESAIGRSILDLVHPTERERLSMKFAALFREKKARLLQEERITRSDGQILLLEWSVVPMTFGNRPARQLVVRDIARRKKAEEELQASREEYRRLSDHLDVVRELEQAEISREIHDQVGQLLAVLMMDLSWLKSRLPRASTLESEGIAEKIERMSLILREAIASVRSITHRLRPALLDHLGLGAAIEDHAQEFQNETGICCQVTLPSDDLAPSHHAALGLFRILQVALARIPRDPSVSPVQVALETRGDDWVLRVGYPLAGLPESKLPQEEPIDLLKIRERVRKLGGRLSTGCRENYFQMETRVPKGD